MEKDTNIKTDVVDENRKNNKRRPNIMKQTLKMLCKPSINRKNKREEYGWNAYLRNKYSYMDQLRTIEYELKTLLKLKDSDIDEFNERKQFYTKEVIIALCEDYLDEYVASDRYEINQYQILQSYYYEIKEVDSYEELYELFKGFYKKRAKLDNYYAKKCPMWVDTYKGFRAYYTLKDMILNYDITIHGMDKNESIKYLKEYALSLDNHNKWRIYNLLKDVIRENNIDLNAFIESLENDR